MFCVPRTQSLLVESGGSDEQTRTVHLINDHIESIADERELTERHTEATEDVVVEVTEEDQDEVTDDNFYLITWVDLEFH